MVTLKSVRGPNVQVGDDLVARIWLSNGKKEQVKVNVTSVEGEKIKDGLKIVTDKLVAETLGGVLKTEHNGKQLRVTFAREVNDVAEAEAVEA